MTTAEQIVAECEARGVRLTLGERAGTLEFDAPAGAMSAELRDALAAHKGAIVDALFEREERAALQGAPEWMDAATFLRVVNHPAVMKLQSVGLCHEIVSVRPGARESEAA